MSKLNLAHHIGTEQYYKHWLGGLYTDGVKDMADQANAYWLIDTIFSHQHSPKVRKEYFQQWILGKGPNEQWVLICDDGNGNIKAIQQIGFSDFPDEKISFFLCDNVLMLPSEY